MELIERVKEFMDNEARSCSMDYGCITPTYIYRMWGGTVALEDITEALNVCKKERFRFRLCVADMKQDVVLQ